MSGRIYTKKNAIYTINKNTNIHPFRGLVDCRKPPPGGRALSYWDEEEEIYTQANEELPGTILCFIGPSLYFLLLTPLPPGGGFLRSNSVCVGELVGHFQTEGEEGEEEEMVSYDQSLWGISARCSGRAYMSK